MNRAFFATAAVPALSLGLALLAACGSSGGGSSGPVPAGTGTVDLLVSASDVPGLLAFEATLSELRLVDEASALSENLLPGPTALEWLGLQNVASWLANRELPAGTYTGLQLSLAPGSERAVARDGSEILVLPTTQQLLLETSPLEIAAGEPAVLELFLDLAGSIEGDLEQGVISFTPSGQVFTDGQRPLDELHGRVREVAAERELLLVEAFRDDLLSVSLGELEVQLSADTRVVAADGERLARDEFYRQLVPEKSVLALRGERTADGSLAAERIALETPDAARVRIEGVVAGTAQRGSFVLLVRDIEKGEELAESVLSGLQDPRAIPVVYDDATVFRAHDERVTAEDLAPGTEVTVEFRSFSAPPFPADSVALEQEHEGGCTQGILHSLAGMPASFELAPGKHEPSVDSGEVDPKTLIRVLLEADTELELDTHGKPALAPEHLVVGMGARVCGALDPGDEPVLHAREIHVHHGHFVHGDVLAFDAAAGTVQTSSSRIVQGFGALVEDGPLTVRLVPGTRFEQAASSREEFFELLSKPDARAEIQVKGVGAADPGTVVAFEIRLKVR